VVLDVQNLSGGVFNDVSFQVHAGEVVGFFGLVGAGRSEIMRAIFGVDKIKGGTVSMNGKPLKSGSPSAAIQAGIGFCTEDRKKEGLALRLSILLNSTIVKLPQLSTAGVINKAKQRADADKYVTAMRTKTPSITQLVGNLSGGNQQKVVLAKWLTTHPDLLIVDEPTRGIDVGSKAEIYEIINDLAKDGMAIIVVSSEIEEILGVCDSVITICDGKKTAQFPIDSSLSKEEQQKFNEVVLAHALSGDAATAATEEKGGVHE
jgi:ribose transport system ATP-binding protein